MEDKRRVNVNIDHSELGFFTDNVTISHNPNKFIFDFVQVTPRFDRIGDDMQQSLAVKHNTIIMDPIMARNILEILKDNLEKYEKNFGEIKIQKRKAVSKPMEYSEESTRYIG
ncbi:MAG: hypothetical protein COY38_03675 [Candidatus Aenigmarchaeota archaeon CG_4_10_14_0_8_um_filter_37_24]|nr:DUF3467 domain-containing protein [Candidatus Aenigmarchaeota archaeon]PIV68688.1 MAG: hypothetical protein COS07_03360 [Candidatus Aenigmarchaeota archaeon CG01_land_8_20_14_3_00_37_9]PIW41160.1 MAG: hypothetical protein COW21_03210 [Candidatus Aenigmarchaeota archaeon CG15_BIG_FIL_POST_REV_8_21_14_020_37_27]PIX50790.1 MAG: hypothetical protein COZ52_02135 [Candidatus Aenigmarchaeota archaeon CG_4_8_14_3_um_filter_37_24]PIY35162.1 MAG: hypothetical protein COZ04_04540 [Candidatus Aenigmarch